MQSFINLTESTFPDVAYTCFLYSQQLVFSGLEQDDMRILYRYITAGFLLNLPLDTKPAEEVRRCAHSGFPRERGSSPNAVARDQGHGRPSHAGLGR